MKLYNIPIPVYADSETQAQDVSVAMATFVSELREQGRAVTATKLIEAINKWQNNAFVKSEILRHFPRIK